MSVAGPLLPHLTLRDSGDEDCDAIRAIYAHHVLHGTGSFEIEPPDLHEIRRRREAVVANGFPWIVAQVDARVVGYAYASFYRARPAYRFTVENSIYVDAALTGRGAGRLLLDALVERCERIGCRQMIAVIGDSANTGSIALHAACGFRVSGVLRSVGWKFDRWLDTVMMQRELGEGDDEPATGYE